MFATVGRYEQTGSAVFTRNVVHAQLLSVEPQLPVVATLKDPVEQPMFAITKGTAGRAAQHYVVDEEDDDAEEDANGDGVDERTDDDIDVGLVVDEYDDDDDVGAVVERNDDETGDDLGADEGDDDSVQVRPLSIGIACAERRQ